MVPTAFWHPHTRIFCRLPNALFRKVVVPCFFLPCFSFNLSFVLPLSITHSPFPHPTISPPSQVHRRTIRYEKLMAEGRAANSSKDATKKHKEDPLVVLLTKVERTLQQLAVLEAEEQRRRPAKVLSPPAAPPQPPPRQAATSAFAFSQQHHNNKARVHPIEEPLPSVPPRPASELK